MNKEVDPTLDENLYITILARFAIEMSAEFSNLRVGVLNGVVHLAGLVSSIETRSRIAKLARSVPGVRGVVNRIEAPGAPPPARTINLDLEGHN